MAGRAVLQGDVGGLPAATHTEAMVHRFLRPSRPLRLRSVAVCAGAVCLLLAPAVPLVWAKVSAVRGDQIVHPIGDHAALELYTRAAAEGRQLLGPHSRLAFHHPGPLYFYACVPLYLLSGESYGGISLTALAINCLAVLAMLVIAARAAGLTGCWATALALSTFLCVRRPEWLIAAWNPYVVVLPFGVLLLALAAFAAGRDRALFAAVLAGSFAMQTHVGSAPVAIALTLLALALRGHTRIRGLAGLPPAARNGAPAALVGAGVILLVLWAPPLVEQLSGNGGNLGRLVAVAHEQRGKHDLSEVVGMVAQGVASGLMRDVAPRARDAAQGFALALFLGTVVVLALIGAHLIARRRHDTFVGSLSILCLAGILVTLLAVRGTADVLFAYLISWTAMFGVGAQVAGVRSAVLLLDGPGEALRHARVVAAVLTLLLLAGLCVSSFSLALAEARTGPTPKEVLRSRRIERLAGKVANALATRGAHRALVVVEGSASTPIATSLVLALDKRGAPIAVSGFGSLQLRGRLAPDGSEDTHLIVRAASDRRARPWEQHVAGPASGLQVALTSAPGR